SRQTISKYLADPHPPRPLIPRLSQLDPFIDEIARLLEIDPKVSAAVIRQRLQEQGFAGGITIVRDYLHGVRGATKKPSPSYASNPPRACNARSTGAISAP